MLSVRSIARGVVRYSCTGAKSSTSDLLIANCDEFIYYDDLIRAATEGRRAPKRGKAKEDKKQEAADQLLEVLQSVEQDYDPVWGSALKQAVRRVYPGFNEAYYGYASIPLPVHWGTMP